MRFGRRSLEATALARRACTKTGSPRHAFGGSIARPRSPVASAFGLRYLVRVAEPLIPYISLPEIPLGFLLKVPVLGQLFDPAHPPSIKPFGTLVALGVYIGSVITMHRARQRGLDAKKMNEFIFWVVAAGFVGGHVLDAIFYHPQRVARDPLYLVMLWDGLSSYGGFIGAILGLVAYKYVKREKVLPYAEVVVATFPIAWIFGRAGCTVVHDHPGRLSDAWFAVRYPMGDGWVGRYDLGFVEFALTIPLAIIVSVLWARGPKPPGYFIGIVCASYAPVRFVLDFLREEEGTGMLGGDPRYGGLTPAQWACFGLLGLGLYFIFVVARKGGASAQPDAPPEGKTGKKKKKRKAAAAKAEEADAATEQAEQAEQES